MPTTPTFYLTSRQTLRPEAVLLAILLAAGLAYGVRYALSHGPHGRLADSRDSARSGSGAAGTPGAQDDDDDDPNQIDTIVLGDPTDAPRPARRGNHVSSVHPTILIVLPRSGGKLGLIPPSPAGHLLYDWLAAFNKSNPGGLAAALPSAAPASAVAAQMKLRAQTGGFNLLTSKEVQPGVLVFRLRDQSPAGVEVLGTLQVCPDCAPAAVASFSLRDVPSAPPDASPAPR